MDGETSAAAIATGTLIVFAGPPCSGKSTVAEALAGRIGVAYLSMDATRRRILPDAAHTRADRQAAYRAMNLAAELLLRADAGVVLDAPYGHAEDRAEIAETVRATGARFLLVECRVSPEAAVRRLHERGFDPDRPDLTDAIVRETARAYPFTGSGVTLDTEALTPEEAVERVYQALLRGRSLRT